jgi:putative OPT family oligopeptide transporter
MQTPDVKATEGSAGQNVSGEDYIPKVPAHEEQDELTAQAILLGVMLSVIFGAANAYLGLRVGMTVSASIPAAVIGMGVLRGIFKRGSLLETNMVQTVGSAGESLAAGVIFTVPALILLSREYESDPPGLFMIFSLACLGGLLGVLFMIPLRRFLMVKEHKVLPFPEGTACAEVLSAGQEGGGAATLVFKGLGIGAIYKLIMHFGKKAHLLTSGVEWSLPSLGKAAVGIDLEASLLGVGFILGPQIGGYMMAGAVLGWLVFIPAIGFLAAGATTPLYPSPELVSAMSVGDIWNYYIRYIGAGAVAFGGVLSLFKALPMIYQTLTSGVLGGAEEQGEQLRTQKDLESKYVFGGVAFIAFLLLVMPFFKLSLVGVFCLVFFSFFFTTVSARIVGIVGSSSNPASGMTIATLLATALLLKSLGYTGTAGMLAAITIGSIVCIGICIGGDTSQDLKTGFLVGATPWKQQVGELIGVLASAACVGATLYILDSATPLGSKALPAPQATLMKLVVQGVMDGNLPWGFVSLGVFTGLAVELLGIGCLPFAVGLYLPFSLSAPIMVGGLIRWLYDTRLHESVRKIKVDRGILLASGLIAGEALMGVVLAMQVAYQNLVPQAPKAVVAEVVQKISEGQVDLYSLACFGLLTVLFFKLYLEKVEPPEEDED